MKNFPIMLLSIIIMFPGIKLSFAQTADIKFEVTVPIEGFTSETSVFLAGSFNCWNPRDSLYIMIKTGENQYSLNVPVFAGHKYEYKYTLGDWSTAEITSVGEQTKNRHIISQDGIVVRDTVMKWGTPLSVAQNNAAQNIDTVKMKELANLKDELGKKVDARMKGAVEVSKKAIQNMLAENPDIDLRKKYHNEILNMIDSTIGTATDFMWKLTSMLSPDQKKQILAEMTDTNDPGAIIEMITKELVTPGSKN